MIPDKSIIDYHCHVAGIGYGTSGCFISKEMMKSYKFSIYLNALGVKKTELEKHGDSLVIERLNQKIQNSKYIRQAVILALDGKVENGELNRKATEFYVPNE